jgi:hypothetical protein
VQPSDGPPPRVGPIDKAADPNTSYEAKRLIKESVDPKALKLGVSKPKPSKNVVMVGCKSKTDYGILEKELSKLRTFTAERPKRKLPNLLLMYVPKDAENVIKDIITHQNLSHIEDPVLNIKFTKRTFEDSRHIIIEVSPNLRRELVALRKIKRHWNMCKDEDFVIVTSCLGFGHTSKFCQNQQKCSHCAEDHHWKECGSQHPTQCSTCLKANTCIH